MRSATYLSVAMVVLAAVTQAERMTVQAFLSKDPLPVNFWSEKVAWLRKQNPVVEEDRQIIKAIHRKDPSVLRDLVACPICSECMHSSTLVTTNCGHGFHAECFSQHVAKNGDFCPTCNMEGPHTELWKRTVLRESLGIFDDKGWIPANPGRNESAGRITAGKYSELDSLQVDFASNEIRWLGVQATVVDTDKEIISAVENSDSALLHGVTLCPICYECMHSATIMTTKCGHTFHAQCFKQYSKGNKEIPCPYCRNSGPHDNDAWKGTLLKDALRLFENEGWIPGRPMTMDNFLASKPLPVDFASSELQLLLKENAMIATDNQVIDAIMKQNSYRLRDLVACPICSKPMHSDTLFVTKCGHWVHEDCFSLYFDHIGDICPVCNKGGIHNAHPEQTFFNRTLHLFGKLGWIPRKPRRISYRRFHRGKSLYVDFRSRKVKWLVKQRIEFNSETNLLDAIETMDPERLRKLVNCPICNMCIHSASLKMTACGHVFHEACFYDLSQCLATGGNCECPVCKTKLTRDSELVAQSRSRNTMFKQALYLFEFEGWIPARKRTDDEDEPDAPFRYGREGSVFPNNWLRDVLPLQPWMLPVESHTAQGFRLFMKDRFSVHIKIFLHVIKKIAKALDVCSSWFIVNRIIKQYKKGRAVPRAMCYLPHRELKHLDSKFLHQIEAKYPALVPLFREYGAPIREISTVMGETVIYVGETERPLKVASLTSSKTRADMSQKLYYSDRTFDNVLPEVGEYKAPNDTATLTKLAEDIRQRMSRPADPAAAYHDAPMNMARWLRKLAERNGPVNSALEMGVTLIFADVRPDWMRKAYEWLKALKVVISSLLDEQIEIRSEDMEALVQHHRILEGLLLTPVVTSSGLAVLKVRDWQSRFDKYSGKFGNKSNSKPRHPRSST